MAMHAGAPFQPKLLERKQQLAMIESLCSHRVATKWEELSTEMDQLSSARTGRTDNEIKNYWHSNLKNKSNAKSEVSQTVSAPHMTNPSISSTSVQSIDTMNTGSSLTGSLSLSMSTEECQPDTLATTDNFMSYVVMPKLMFSEWLSPRQQEQNISVFQGGYGDQLVPRECFNQFTGSQEFLLPEVSFGESSFYNDFNPPDGFYFSPPYELKHTNAAQESDPANET